MDFIMGNGYLALTRRTGEELFLYVNDSNGSTTEIRIDMNKINANTVKVGIDAPKTVDIVRGELLSELESI